MNAIKTELWQIYNLLTAQWRNGSDPQKDRALHDCSLLEAGGRGAVVVAGNDFSPSDLAEVRLLNNETILNHNI